MRKRPTLKAITQHALERFQERGGSTRPTRCLTQIEKLLAVAVPLGRGKWYGNGWIICVKNGVGEDGL